MNFTLKIILAIFILKMDIVFAQLPDIEFENILIDDGVGDAVGIFDMIQDSNGYLWLATLDGLSRYDGL